MGDLRGSGARRIGLVAVVAAGAFCLSALPAAADSNPVSSQEWWLNGQLDFAAAWSTAEGDGVTVAVIGSTIDPNQQDLTGSLLPGVAFPADAPNTDTNPHSSGCYGTQAATLIAGHGHSDNAVTGGISGIMGLAPHAQVFPVTVHQVPGQALADPSYLAQAIRAAALRHVKIIDVVFPASDNPALTSAVDEAMQMGSIVVAPIGDVSATGGKAVAPADIPGVVSVTAVDSSSAVPVFASGTGRAALAAPGAAIAAGNYANTYTATHAGTSCAADLVAAEAALVASAHPSWTADQIVSAMVATASGHGHKSGALGYGTIDPAAAVATSPSTANPLGGQHSAPADAAARGGQSSNVLMIVLIAVAAALVLGIAVFFVLRKRKPRRYSYPEPAPYRSADPNEMQNLYGSGFGYDTGQHPVAPQSDAFGYSSLGGVEQPQPYAPQGYTHEAYGYQQPYSEQPAPPAPAWQMEAGTDHVPGQSQPSTPPTAESPGQGAEGVQS